MSMTLQADPKARVSEIIRKVTTIATLPEVTVRIIKTVEDPRSSATTAQDRFARPGSGHCAF